MSNEVVIPGSGYVENGAYVPPHIERGNDGGSSLSCSWPYVMVDISYTKITITDPIPGRPGQPYIPPSLPRWDANENAGWGNSSARSVQPLNRSQRFVFSPGHDIRGFFVGLAPAGKDLSHPAVFAIGISCLQSGVTVTESSENKAALAASIDPLDEVSIEIAVDGSIACKHSNSSVYYSSVSFTDPVYIYAQGYQAQDSLLSAKIEDFISFSPAPTLLAIQEAVGSTNEVLVSVPAALSVQETVGVAIPDHLILFQETVGVAGAEYLATQETVGIAGAEYISTPALLAVQENIGTATGSVPASVIFATQETVGMAGAEFLSLQETVGNAIPNYFSVIQETVGIAVPCFLLTVSEVLSVQETVGIADSKFDLYCEIFGRCSTVAGLSNSQHCAISGNAPCDTTLLNNDNIPPRLNSTGFLVMPDIGAIDGGGMIATCEISAEDISGSSLSDVDNYCAIGGFDGSQKAELKNSPAGYLWSDDSIRIAESSSFLRDVLINLYSSLDFIDGLSLFKDIAVGLIESNLIYDVNDIIADKDILLEETCNLLESLELNINGLPDYIGGTAWVINMETGATSLFLDYDYNSFMTSPSGEVYGVCKDGIYLLNGTGSTAPMSAIDYGIHRFGSETKKMIPHFYASVASTGRLIFKLAVGECEYEYYAMSSSEYLDKHRIDVGKGIGAGKRFIFANPVLMAPEGVEIKELEMLEYLPVAFDRRK